VTSTTKEEIDYICAITGTDPSAWGDGDDTSPVVVTGDDEPDSGKGIESGRKYDENQPRDEDGKFGSGGGSSGAESSGEQRSSVPKGATYALKKSTRKDWSDDDVRSICGVLPEVPTEIEVKQLENGKTELTSRSEIGTTKVTVGKGEMRLDSLLVYDEYQGQNYGTRQFAGMVDVARKQGTKQITMEAARDEDMNGYYTWARLGVDGPIPKELVADAREASGKQSATTVMDLMFSEQGRTWWKENGDTFEGTFPLKKGSLSVSIFNGYRKAKGL